MAEANMNAILSPLAQLPPLSEAVDEFTQVGVSFLEELYLFQSNSVYSAYIATQLPTRGLCCLKFQHLDFKALNAKLLLKEEPAVGELTQVCDVETKQLGDGGAHGIPFTFTLNGVTHLVKLSKDIKVFAPKIWGKIPPADLKRLHVANIQGLYECWLPRDYVDTTYVGMDEFTNETLIAGIIDKTWNKVTKSGISTHEYFAVENFFPYVVHTSAALCGHNIRTVIKGTEETRTAVKLNSTVNGLNLMEYCNKGNLVDITSHSEYCYEVKYEEEENHPVFEKKFTPREEKVLAPDIARGILFHVIYAFHFLHVNLHFNHGDAKIKNVFLHRYNSDTKVTWQVGGVQHEIVSPVCAKLADYGKSSLTHRTKQGPIRLFWEPDSTIVQLFRDGQIKSNPFIPDVYKDTYTVNMRTDAATYVRLRMMGIPFYKSYDVYMFMVSFFLQPWAFYLLSMYSEFKKLSWDILWKHYPEGGNIVYKRIQQRIKEGYNTSKLHGTGILIKTLKGIPLACNITHDLLDGLAQFKHERLVARNAETYFN